jgi:hypothetical protein
MPFFLRLVKHFLPVGMVNLPWPDRIPSPA